MSSIKRNGSKCTTAYTYETASDGGQTGRVKTVKNGSYSENYTYDTWGNVTKVTENSSQTGKAYAYDAQGQLIREYDPDKKVWLGYKYDAGGNLTEVRSYQAAGGSILAEKKNGKWQHYLYEGSGQLMAIRYKGADYYYIRDGLMCITGLVDANGGAVVNYRYDSWGKLISITGSMAGTLGKDNSYRYKGYYYDDETGLYKNLK